MRGSASRRRSPAQRAAKPKRSARRAREDYGWGRAGGVIEPDHPTSSPNQPTQPPTPQRAPSPLPPHPRSSPAAWPRCPPSEAERPLRQTRFGTVLPSSTRTSLRSPTIRSHRRPAAPGAFARRSPQPAWVGHRRSAPETSRAHRPPRLGGPPPRAAHARRGAVHTSGRRAARAHRLRNGARRDGSSARCRRPAIESHGTPHCPGPRNSDRVDHARKPSKSARSDRRASRRGRGRRALRTDRARASMSAADRRWSKSS